MPIAVPWSQINYVYYYLGQLGTCLESFQISSLYNQGKLTPTTENFKGLGTQGLRCSNGLR